MYTHRLVSVCLLVAYGIPAAVGPYWHNHQAVSTYHACTDAACSEYESSSTSSENAEESSCGSHCSCSAQSNETGDCRSAGQAERSPARLSADGLHRCSDHCTICAFYAQSTIFPKQCVAPTSSALWAWLRGAYSSDEGSLLRAFSARGPPAAVLSIA